jgi:hypothetical protein
MRRMPPLPPSPQGDRPASARCYACHLRQCHDAFGRLLAAPPAQHDRLLRGGFRVVMATEPGPTNIHLGFILIGSLCVRYERGIRHEKEPCFHHRDVSRADLCDKLRDGAVQTSEKRQASASHGDSSPPCEASPPPQEAYDAQAGGRTETNVTGGSGSDDVPVLYPAGLAAGRSAFSSKTDFVECPS